MAAEEFTYLRARTTRPVKVTLVSAQQAAAYYDPDKSRAAYPTRDAYLADLVDFTRREIQELRRLGCEYIQIDAPQYAALLDEKIREGYRQRGSDPDRLLDCVHRAGQRDHRRARRRDVRHSHLSRQLPQHVLRVGRLRSHRAAGVSPVALPPLPPRIRRCAVGHVRAAGVRPGRSRRGAGARELEDSRGSKRWTGCARASRRPRAWCRSNAWPSARSAVSRPRPKAIVCRPTISARSSKSSPRPPARCGRLRPNRTLISLTHDKLICNVRVAIPGLFDGSMTMRARCGKPSVVRAGVLALSLLPATLCLAQPPTPPATTRYQVTVVRIKPDMVDEWVDLQKNEVIPAQKKGGVKERTVMQTAIGNSFEYHHPHAVPELRGVGWPSTARSCSRCGRGSTARGEGSQVCRRPADVPDQPCRRSCDSAGDRDREQNRCVASGTRQDAGLLGLHQGGCPAGNEEGQGRRKNRGLPGVDERRRSSGGRDDYDHVLQQVCRFGRRQPAGPGAWRAGNRSDHCQGGGAGHKRPGHRPAARCGFELLSLLAAVKAAAQWVVGLSLVSMELEDSWNSRAPSFSASSPHCAINIRARSSSSRTPRPFHSRVASALAPIRRATSV